MCNAKFLTFQSPGISPKSDKNETCQGFLRKLKVNLESRLVSFYIGHSVCKALHIFMNHTHFFLAETSIHLINS